MIIYIVVLAIALIIAIIYIILLNIDISKMNRKIDWLSHSKSNIKLTTGTFNKQLSELIIRINEVLEKESQIEIQSMKMDKEMKQIITNISHDLRTPLTSAIGYIQLAQDDKVPIEKKKQYLEIVETRLKVLTKLLEDFFEFTKILENKVEIEKEKINISSLLNETLLTYYEDFRNKGLVPKINITPNVYLYCNSNALKRIFENIIKNTLMHAETKFEICVEKSEKIKITFKNKICNDSHIEAEKLFERFYTSDISRTNKSTGLGLAIVRELVSQMGGTVVAEIENSYLYIYINI